MDEPLSESPTLPRTIFTGSGSNLRRADNAHFPMPAILVAVTTLTSTPVRKIALASAGFALLIPVMTGCFNGQQATTNVQATNPSGNGAQANLGGIVVDNVTVVQGPGTTATLLMRATNQGLETDALVGATIDGEVAEIVGTAVQLMPGDSFSFGWDSVHYVNANAFEAPMSSYVPVTLQFANAGMAELDVLIVPPTGIYEGIAPGQ